MLIDLSGENICLYDHWNSSVIERFSMEDEFPRVCKHYRENTDTQDIYVIQWPWSFTSLRLGMLVIHTLQVLVYPECTVHAIPKPLWWASLLSMCDSTMSYYSCTYFIGQKKNCGYVSSSYDTLICSLSDNSLHDHIHILPRTQLHTKLFDDTPCYTDRSKLSTHYASHVHKLTIRSYNQWTVVYTIGNTSHTLYSSALQSLPWSTQYAVAPYYGIRPNISG